MMILYYLLFVVELLVVLDYNNYDVDNHFGDGDPGSRFDMMGAVVVVQIHSKIFSSVMIMLIDDWILRRKVIQLEIDMNQMMLLFEIDFWLKTLH